MCLLDFTVVDMELSLKALEFHLLKFTLRIEHPEYAVRHRALLMDHTHYEKQIEESKVKVSELKIGILSVQCAQSLGACDWISAGLS